MKSINTMYMVSFKIKSSNCVLTEMAIWWRIKEYLPLKRKHFKRFFALEFSCKKSTTKLASTLHGCVSFTNAFKITDTQQEWNSILFAGFWNKTKLTVHTSPDNAHLIAVHRLLCPSICGRVYPLFVSTCGIIPQTSYSWRKQSVFCMQYHEVRKTNPTIFTVVNKGFFSACK